MSDDVVTAPGKNGGTLMPFQKGKSGNPSGMPRLVGELQKAARLRTMEMLDIVVAIASDPNAKQADRLKAIEMIWDRACGKPKQGVELTGEDGEPIKQAIKIAVSFHEPGDAGGPVIDGTIDGGSIPEGV